MVKAYGYDSTFGYEPDDGSHQRETINCRCGIVPVHDHMTLSYLPYLTTEERSSLNFLIWCVEKDRR